MCGHSQIQMTLADMNGLFVEPERAELSTETAIVSAAVSLGADTVAGWSRAESKLAKAASPVPKRLLEDLRQHIHAGEDPLGEAFCRIRRPSQRRQQGATFTPQKIVDAMVNWSAEFDHASRVVDPGVGSGRYLVSAGRRFPRAELIGVEIDPLPAILARANLAVAGLARRSQIILNDYRSVVLQNSKKTLFLGNPPYVRHHLLDTGWKKWLIDEAAKLGHSASQLAGLHVHFFLATVARAQKGDFGAFITAAEWLDVNYGSLVRDLFLAELGGRRIVVIEPSAMPFPDAATTAAITFFQIGAQPKSIKLKRVESLDELEKSNGNRTVRRERLAAERRWSHLTRIGRKGPEGFVELGELCRVHRGQVTGFNKVWIAGPHSAALPENVLFPSVTKARELIRAGPILSDASVLRRVIDLPLDLDEFDARERNAVDRFLAEAKSLGAHLGYVATNRKAWWSVGLRDPAPILATYMARRPPAFVRNKAQARHINIAHGIYPREPLSAITLTSLVEFLSRSVCVTEGRTYAGGLTKFEPREMERLLVPSLELLTKA